MEDEIVKHTRKIYRVVKNKKISPWKKLGEIAMEILIIVFAVSLAALFERMRERAHKAEEAKEFLIGAKEDLKGTIESAKWNVKQLNNYQELYTYFSSLKRSVKPNKDSLKANFSYVTYNTDLEENNSRYVGFKSSGKLEQIENKTLLARLLAFYEKDLHYYNNSASYWRNQQGKLLDMIENEVVEKEDGTNNVFEVLTTQKAKRLTKSLIPWKQFYDRNEAIITDATEIVEEIDKEYKLR